MKKILFLSMGLNPGTAPFNRFQTINKMINNAGYNTSIIFTHPIPNNRFKRDFDLKKGDFQYDTLKFQNVRFYTKKENIIWKVIIKTEIYFSAARLIRNESKNNKIILYLLSIDIWDFIFFYLVKKLFGIKYICERSEFPLLIRSPKKIKTLLYKYFVLPWIYKLFDGMVIMTQILIDFYGKYVREGCSILKIPMTVDPDRFNNVKQVSNTKYIGYVGSLSSKKDGLDILIKAFAKIADHYPECYLKIAGASKATGELEYLIKLSDHLHIADKVHFVGKLEQHEIPGFLMSASILILARPDSKQAEGGFPTKLGEYLMTGKPVIVTDVGEISSYLENGKDAFIIQPGNEEELAIKISFIFKNPAKAALVGREGKKTSEKFFDYRIYSDSMHNFLENLF